MISHSFDSDFSFNIVVSVKVYEMEGKKLYYLDGGGEWMVVEALRRLDGEEAVTWTCSDSWLVYSLSFDSWFDDDFENPYVIFFFFSVCPAACLVWFSTSLSSSSVDLSCLPRMNILWGFWDDLILFLVSDFALLTCLMMMDVLPWVAWFFSLSLSPWVALCLVALMLYNLII